MICVLGEGSFAKVYLGLNLENLQYYAIKRIHLKELTRTSSGITQLEREIEVMRTLKHPHIVQLHEVIHVPDKSCAYIVMDYADCGNLSALLEDGKQFTVEEIGALFKQIAEGVGFLHENGIVHQDIKPANILLKSDGTALLSDFGVGHSFQSAAMVVGTPAYQAPEVIDECEMDEDYEEDGEGDDPGKEDIWSLGVTLYELCFGETPFSGANVFEIVRSIATTTLEMPPGANEDLWSLIEHMLAVNPAKRYSIDRVLDHPFVANADISKAPRSEPFKPPVVDPAMPVTKITGTVCQKGYSFALHDKSAKRAPKPFSLPFRSPFM